MAAKDKALDLVELFENIILQLPGQFIPNLCYFSKRWNTIITTSHAIQFHYRNRVLIPERFDGNYEDVPVYMKSPNMRVHPLIRHATITGPSTPAGTVKHVTVFGPMEFDSERLIAARDEFATIPPCQNMHMSGTRDSCFSVKTGIKIGDLLDIQTRHNAAVTASESYCGCELMCGFTTMFKVEI